MPKLKIHSNRFRRFNRNILPLTLIEFSEQWWLRALGRWGKRRTKKVRVVSRPPSSHFSRIAIVFGASCLQSVGTLLNAAQRTVSVWFIINVNGDINNKTPKSWAENFNKGLRIAKKFKKHFVVITNDIIFTKDWFEPLKQKNDAIIIPSCNINYLYNSTNFNTTACMQIQEYTGK